jgi:hypothetical protein
MSDAQLATVDDAPKYAPGTHPDLPAPGRTVGPIS